jgi:predicted Zn finger-like uncharacterized protein
MQIVCPNCTTSYQIADTAVGKTGRSVRCVRCQTVWQVPPPVTATPGATPGADETVAAFSAELGARPAAPASAPAPPPPAPPPSEGLPEEPSLGELIRTTAFEETADAAGAPDEAPAMALADIPSPVEESPPLVPAPPVTDVTSLDDSGPPDIESVAARRARAAARKRRSRLRVPLPVAIVALVTLSVALLGWRRDVVRYAPQLASFYSAIGLPVNLRGLSFADLKIGSEIHDGVPVLVIEGMIVSMVSRPVDVPRLRFALRSATGAEVYAWTAQPSQPVLDPFEAMPFRSRLASPPAEGHDIQVRFFTRRDAVAGLH